MEQLFDRYRTIALLGLLLVGQLLMLAWQVRRPDAGGVRLLRVWTIEAIVPVEKVSQWAIGGVRSFLHNYVALHEAEQQNQDLQRQVGQLRLQNEELQEQVRSMPQLAELLAYQESYINRTMEADVIGSGASASAQVIYLNRGEQDGVRRNMPVITPDGVVGKITQVFHGTAEVLLLTDPDSGVGAMLEQSRLHGILQGRGNGRAELRLIVDDQQVHPGEHLITSGEDQVYPKGLPLGTVISARPGNMFQNIRVKLAVDLGRLEGVLIVTGEGKSTMPQTAPSDAMTAAQIRQAQLPTIPEVAVVPRTGPPPPMAQILAERRQAAIAAAKAANAKQQGLTPSGGAQPGLDGAAANSGKAGMIPASGTAGTTQARPAAVKPKTLGTQPKAQVPAPIPPGEN